MSRQSQTKKSSKKLWILVLILSLLLFAAHAGAETPIFVNPDSAPATAEETAAPVYAVITPEGNTPCR
jgi:flagellar basal body-associated protein FliL